MYVRTKKEQIRNAVQKYYHLSARKQRYTSKRAYEFAIKSKIKVHKKKRAKAVIKPRIKDTHERYTHEPATSRTFYIGVIAGWLVGWLVESGTLSRAQPPLFLLICWLPFVRESRKKERVMKKKKSRKKNYTYSQ